MKLTNKYNLPQPYVDAVKNDDYDKGLADISITALIAPPRIRVLKKIHDDVLEEDVSDRFYSLMGQLMHALLERSKSATSLAEKRFYIDIEIDGKKITVGGKMDAIYFDGLIQDYKLVSYWQVKDGIKPDFIQQLNCYAYLVEYGYYIDDKGEKAWLRLKANRLENFFGFRDWSKSKAKYDGDIPQQQAMTLNVPLWESDKTLAFIKERLQIHLSANKKLPLCTSEDMWEKPEKWAVMKKGAAKSLKNHVDKAEAEKHAARVGAKVEYRKGERTRCEDYCVVAKFCTQFQKYKKAQAEKEAAEKLHNPPKGEKETRNGRKKSRRS